MVAGAYQTHAGVWEARGSCWRLWAGAREGGCAQGLGRAAVEGVAPLQEVVKVAEGVKDCEYLRPPLRRRPRTRRLLLGRPQAGQREGSRRIRLCLQEQFDHRRRHRCGARASRRQWSESRVGSLRVDARAVREERLQHLGGAAPLDGRHEGGISRVIFAIDLWRTFPCAGTSKRVRRTRARAACSGMAPTTRWCSWR